MLLLGFGKKGWRSTRLTDTSTQDATTQLNSTQHSLALGRSRSWRCQASRTACYRHSHRLQGSRTRRVSVGVTTTASLALGGAVWRGQGAARPSTSSAKQPPKDTSSLVPAETRAGQSHRPVQAPSDTHARHMDVNPPRQFTRPPAICTPTGSDAHASAS